MERRRVVALWLALVLACVAPLRAFAGADLACPDVAGGDGAMGSSMTAMPGMPDCDHGDDDRAATSPSHHAACGACCLATICADRVGACAQAAVAEGAPPFFARSVPVARANVIERPPSATSR